MYVTVLGAVVGLVGMTGVVWVTLVVVFWNTDFALNVSVGEVMMAGMGVGGGGMVVVVVVDVVGVTVVAIILVTVLDGEPRLYVRPSLLACMSCTCI